MISNVVTQGYGNGTISPGLSSIVLQGYSLGEEEIISVDSVLLENTWTLNTRKKKYTLPSRDKYWEVDYV